MCVIVYEALSNTNVFLPRSVLLLPEEPVVCVVPVPSSSPRTRNRHCFRVDIKLLRPHMFHVHCRPNKERKIECECLILLIVPYSS